MENFSEEVKSTPILQKIYVVHEKEKKRWYWKGNLKATIQNMFEEKIFFEGMDELSVSDHLELQKFWHGEVDLQSNWCYSLETLKLENCEFKPPLSAIPSKILPHLKSLRELIVRDCNNIKVIFDMNDREITGTAFQLKKLTLQRLSELTHVWEKNSQGIFPFQNLQEVVVSGCENLKTLFPAALAKNLKKLEKLEIEYCDELLEIVGKEAEGTEKFVFPRLTWLDLFWLPKLTYFCPGTFTLECSALNHLYVMYCDKLEVFQSQQEAHPEGEGQGSTSNKTQPLFSDLNAISHLKELALDWKDILVLRFGQFTQDLQYLNELFMYFDYDYENEKSALPFKILEKAPNLEIMGISDCYNLEIFRTQKSKIGAGMLEHLKTLYLNLLYELQSIGSEDLLWLNTICDKVHQLYVFRCPRLTTFVHSAASFSNLKSLDIRQCHGLVYLFTSSAAEKLKHLEEMNVNDCESMKEIVAEKQDEITPEVIEFKLEKIALESLSSLKCFYSGNATLQLPSLIKVVIQECPEMKIFSQGLIHAESFRGIQASFDSNEELVFHDDLKTTVKRQFLHQEHIVVGDYPELEEIWLGVVPVPNRSFSNLKSLVVEGCDFLSNAILSSHLLPFLRKLEELKVRNCNSVKAIFDVDLRPAASPLHLRLKKLTLKVLPTLKHVWNEDSQRSLSLPFLEEVFVEECKSITSLFPASVDKDRLQKLDVRNCERLVEIVAKDEATTKGAIEELVIFPSLAWLQLWNLPNLKCIYPEMHIQEWSMLTELHVYNCQKLKVFATDFQNCPDSHPEGQDSLPTDQQALFSADKVTPHLEELSLNKEDAMMIEQGQLHVDLQKLKFLKLLCFDDVFPYDFLSKVPLPSIEKIGVVDSTFKDIFPSQRPDKDYTKILSQLKGLELNNLYMLNSIGLEHSWMDRFRQNLETLEVLECDCLTNLVPSTVSFSHLTELNVDNCNGLKYLFTSSTAKSLVVLKKMYINNCKSLEKIVAEEENEPGDEEEEEPVNEEENEPDDEEEEDEPDEDEIEFSKLEILSLSSLPRLGTFYTGCSTLNFPYLEEISFTQCHNMKMFSHGDVIPKDLEGKIDGVRWYGDINNEIKRQFEEAA